MPPRARRGLLICSPIGALVLAAAAFAAEQMQEKRQIHERAIALTHGNPGAGREAMERYGCGGCHQVPGVTGARGQVGPPLKGIAGRAYIAGRLRNEPENLIGWIDNPKRVDPYTAMPDVGVGPADARDIAAYLYTLN